MKFILKTAKELEAVGYVSDSFGDFRHPHCRRTVNTVMLKCSGQIIELASVPNMQPYNFTDGVFYYHTDMLKPINTRNLPDWW